MQNIKLSKECPPIYSRLHDKFGVEWEDGLIIAHSPYIYCLIDIPPEKMVHECVHTKRQDEIGVDLWYDRYIEDDAFRLDEEVRAYREEFKFLKKYVKDREFLFHLRNDICKNLSSSIYGNLVTLDEALNIIK